MFCFSLRRLPFFVYLCHLNRKKTKELQSLMSKMEVSTNINPTMKITMLGTGHATVTRCYNTCFVLEQTAGDGTCRLLVDAGGGNGILAQLEKAGIRDGDTVRMYGWYFDFYE